MLCYVMLTYLAGFGKTYPSFLISLHVLMFCLPTSSYMFLKAIGNLF